MKYDIDDLLKEAFESEEFQGENRPSHILNQETISKMRDINKMKKSKKNNKMNRFTKVAAGIVSLGLVVSLSTVAYSAIEQHFNYSIEMEDGVKVEFDSKINYKVLPQEKLIRNEGDSLISMKWDEVEEMLGFSLLGGANETDDKVNYDTYFNEDDSVAVVNLWIPEYKVYGEPLSAEDGGKYYSKKISLSVDILDVNAEQGYVEPFKEGKDAMGSKELVEKYYSEGLDTEVVIYNTNNSEECVSAVFGYDGVYYSLQGANVTVEEMKEAIEDMRK